MKKKLVVLTGAGISAESGIQTFRGGDGLWEGHRIEDVATPEAWERDPELVHEFYNQRRKGVRRAQPNKAHKILADLEERYRVSIITQNIDDLHERAGSTDVLHLHGEICKSRSTIDPELVYDIEEDSLSLDNLCEMGSPLRPHIVWFGEAVPMMEPAIEIVHQADMMIIVGTSLVVYPAASLVNYLSHAAPLWVVDPSEPTLSAQRSPENTFFIKDVATKGVEAVQEKLLSESL